MNHDSVLLRICMDIVGLVLPLLAMAAYLLDWSSVARAVLMSAFYVGIFGTWLLTGGLARWRARQETRVRAIRRRLVGARAHAARRR